jgi:hypothetical protein
VRVTFPVFCAVSVYVIVPPAVREAEAVFVRLMDGDDVAVRVTASVSVTAGPVGGVPVTDAELVNEPASTSA